MLRTLLTLTKKKEDKPMLRKILPLTLVLCLALSAAAFAEVTPKGEFPVTTEPVSLRIAMPVSPKVEDIETNKFTLWTEEMTGIDLSFEVLPNEDTMTKVNLMFASDDLPDVFVGIPLSYLNLIDYSDAGYIIPLDEYIEEYGDNIHRTFELSTNPYVEKLLRLPDGKIYAMPAIVEASSNTWNNRLWIYEPWLKQLGMDMPTTIDELYEYLVAVRDNDLNGNGIDDEIPMMTVAVGNPGNAISFFGNAFQFTQQDHYLDVNDGVVSFIAGNELYKQTITYLHKLTQEGLLHPSSFTQDATQMKAIVASETPIVGAVPYWQKSAFADVTSERGREYVNHTAAFRTRRFCDHRQQYSWRSI
ncbi:MAG: extracellular solute-binding protein [Christensenellales bacterium]|jgi:putative aldouronate transport system substrate-binding protein